MITHYEHLITEENATVAEAVQRGSMERLSPVLMTALSAALALVPLVMAGADQATRFKRPWASLSSAAS